MKLIALFSTLAFSLTTLAQAQVYRLAPGQSMQLSDGSQVVCQSYHQPPMPMPPPPVSPSGPMCVLSFNPTGSTCTQYQLFDSRGTALTSCMGNLNDVQSNLAAMENLGTCVAPQAQTCTVKFNPVGSTCTQYQIFGDNNKALSDCLNTTSDAQSSLNSLRQLGFCGY